MVILCIPLLYVWASLAGTSWYFVLPGAVLWALLALAELYSVARKSGDYIELLPDGIVLDFALLKNLRIPYEAIASAELNDQPFDRTARALLGIVGRSRPPRVKLRFRRRVRLWWIFPVKRLYIRPSDPETVVAALSARLGTAQEWT